MLILLSLIACGPADLQLAERLVRMDVIDGTGAKVGVTWVHRVAEAPYSRGERTIRAEADAAQDRVVTWTGEGFRWESRVRIGDEVTATTGGGAHPPVGEALESAASWASIAMELRDAPAELGRLQVRYDGRYRVMLDDAKLEAMRWTAWDGDGVWSLWTTPRKNLLEVQGPTSTLRQSGFTQRLVPPPEGVIEVPSRIGEPSMMAVLTLPPDIERPPVVVLAPDRGQAREGAWRDLAHALAKIGVASLRVDVRGQGHTRSPRDSSRAQQDVTLLQDFLRASRQLDADCLPLLADGSGHRVLDAESWGATASSAEFPGFFEASSSIDPARDPMATVSDATPGHVKSWVENAACAKIP